jgi:hypothetical protein
MTLCLVALNGQTLKKISNAFVRKLLQHTCFLYLGGGVVFALTRLATNPFTQELQCRSSPWTTCQQKS